VRKYVPVVGVVGWAFASLSLLQITVRIWYGMRRTSILRQVNVLTLWCSIG
jgi:hypothetical protein